MSTVNHRADTARDELIERLTDDLAIAQRAIGVLSERLAWYQAAVDERDTAIGIVAGGTSARRAARHGLTVVREGKSS